VGRATYRLVGADETVCRRLATLAEFAFYAGVGMRTAKGMGQCKRVMMGEGEVSCWLHSA
jgi:CRISPR/Cas system endoribonuclease Cas6 (RAMP superfamily)